MKLFKRFLNIILVIAPLAVKRMLVDFTFFFKFLRKITYLECNSKTVAHGDIVRFLYKW